MKIVEVTRDHILFDNGNKITYDHYQDWCEYNYADFAQLDDLARGHNYNEDLKFEFVKYTGFRFGDDSFMAFVPCYSQQNGYYSSYIDIYYNDREVCSGLCEEDFD